MSNLVTYRKILLIYCAMSVSIFITFHLPRNSTESNACFLSVLFLGLLLA